MLEYKTKIKAIKNLTLHTMEVAVELLSPTDIAFKAGQYMDFVFGDESRAFSITTVPDHNQDLKFCVGLLPQGTASFFFRDAKVGDELIMRGPKGNFTVLDFSQDYFFVATGVGVAPFVSIIPDLLSRGFSQKAHLLFGVRHEEDVFYFDRFTHLQTVYRNFKFTPIVSQPKSHWPGETGRVTTYIEVAYEYYRNYFFYISGSTEPVTAVRELLLKKGHKADNMKLEIFS